jgi:hypothetical protein
MVILKLLILKKKTRTEKEERLMEIEIKLYELNFLMNENMIMILKKQHTIKCLLSSIMTLFLFLFSNIKKKNKN